MKHLFLITLIVAQFAYAQESWNRCLQSYRPAQTALFDLRFYQIGQHQSFVFRNGNHFEREELNVYYKGKFWKAPLDISETDFFKRKTLKLQLGDDRLCLERKFRLILTDNSQLSAFSQQECGEAETLTMRENSESIHPTSQEVLAYKLQKDVNRQTRCISGQVGDACDAEDRRADYDRLSSWSTEACLQLGNSSIQEIVGSRTEALQIFNSTAPN